MKTTDQITTNMTPFAPIKEETTLLKGRRSLRPQRSVKKIRSFKLSSLTSRRSINKQK